MAVWQKRSGNVVFLGLLGAVNNYHCSLGLRNRRGAGEQNATAFGRLRVSSKRLASPLRMLIAGAVAASGIMFYFPFAEEEEEPGDCGNVSDCWFLRTASKKDSDAWPSKS